MDIGRPGLLVVIRKCEAEQALLDPQAVDMLRDVKERPLQHAPLAHHTDPAAPLEDEVHLAVAGRGDEVDRALDLSDLLHRDLLLELRLGGLGTGRRVDLPAAPVDAAGAQCRQYSQPD